MKPSNYYESQINPIIADMENEPEYLGTIVITSPMGTRTKHISVTKDDVADILKILMGAKS